MNPSEQDIRNRLLVARLPAVPQILLKLLELCQADGAGMSELAKLVANDVGMTTKVLQVAHSAAYHRGGQKAGLMQALGLLGIDMVKLLVISESVLQTFNGFPYSNHTDLRVFWKHALTTAVMARDIARLCNYAQTEEAYLAGLLHDVGRLALLSAAPEAYGQTFYAEDSESLCAVELRSMHLSHADAGAWLVERWNLDSFLADAILYHHEGVTRLQGAHPLIRILHTAHQLADHDAAMPLVDDMGTLCNLPSESLLAVHQGSLAQVEKSAAYLGIDIANLDDWVPPVAGPPPAPVVHPIQQKLNEEIRHKTLTAEVGQTLARQNDDVQLLKAVRQGAHILFDLEDTMVLLMDGHAQSLVAVSVGEQRQRLADFVVVLSAGGGIAQSVLQGRVSFLRREGGLMSLAEEQLLRVFGVACLVCIPLRVGNRSLGVMVGAVPSWALADLQYRERFLQAYGLQAAQALDAAQTERGAIDRRIAALKQDFQQSARKVLHEVSNPLAIIKNYLGVLDERLSHQEGVDDTLSILNEEIDRVGSIMREFVGDTPKAVASRLEINSLTSKVVRLFRESKFLPASIDIVAQLAPQDCEVEGSADTLKQILVNLIKNAVEAMPRGGRIEIQSKGRVLREGKLFYELCVKDNGPGIPPEQRSRLFSPVQSAKAGTNRGIGLSIVHDLVQKLGGQIACESGASGTLFVISLPVPMAKPLAVDAARLQTRG